MENCDVIWPPLSKKVRPRISPRPDPIGTGYIRPRLQFVHTVTIIAAVNATHCTLDKPRWMVNAASSGVGTMRRGTLRM
jgi:hypothetical protein